MVTDSTPAAVASTYGTSDPRTQPTAVVQAVDDCPVYGHCVMDCCVDVAGVCDRNDLHPLMHCRCKARSYTTCTNRATQEDGLCDPCRRDGGDGHPKGGT